MKSKKKQITVRLPKRVIWQVEQVAKLAGVTPTQVYNVLLSAYIANTHEPQSCVSPTEKP